MKTIIITGGSKGIGRNLVENFARDGHNIILNYNKSAKEALEIKNNLENEGIKIEIFKADVSKREQVKQLVEFAINKFSNIDVLINNAGISQYKMFKDITNEDWNEIINTNLTSAFYTIQETLPNMIHNKRGCIINISSIWGIVGASCEVAYSVSKAGLNGLTKSLAKELGLSNIRVNAIAPGVINTDMNKKLGYETIEELKSETPLNKIGNPIDIYKCAKWLIEDEFTTGQIISPNGGFVIN